MGSVGQYSEVSYWVLRCISRHALSMALVTAGLLLGYMGVLSGCNG